MPVTESIFFDAVQLVALKAPQSRILSADSHSVPYLLASSEGISKKRRGE